MRPRTASRRVFAKWDLHSAMFTPGPSNIGEVCPLRSCGCTSCLKTLAKWDAASNCLALRIRKMGTSNWRIRVTRPISPHSVRTPEGLTPTWCLENRAEQDAVLYCLVLRIHKIVNSNRRVRATRPTSPHPVLAPENLTPAWCLEN
jgi:hypothetical protein